MENENYKEAKETVGTAVNFEQTNESIEFNHTFGIAIEAIKEGEMVRRKSWDEGKFIFMQIPSKVNMEIVPKMTSLPQSVKDKFEKRSYKLIAPYSSIRYNDQLALVYPDNTICGYTATTSDILAEDWEIID